MAALQVATANSEVSVDAEAEVRTRAVVRGQREAGRRGPLEAIGAETGDVGARIVLLGVAAPDRLALGPDIHAVEEARTKCHAQRSGRTDRGQHAVDGDHAVGRRLVPDIPPDL